MLLFTLLLNPRPQKQTRFSKTKKGVRAYDPSATDKKHIQWQISPYAPAQPFAGPIEVSYTFFLPIPVATSWIKRQQMIKWLILPDKRPDLDNLGYLVTNAMKGIIYKDDSQICSQHLVKVYGDQPRTVVRVRPISTIERVGLEQCG